MNVTVQIEDLRTHFASELALRAMKKPNCGVQSGFFYLVVYRPDRCGIRFTARHTAERSRQSTGS